MFNKAMKEISNAISQTFATPPPIQWSTSLCACHEDTSSCLEAAFCMPCFIGFMTRSVDRHDHMKGLGHNQRGREDNFDCGTCCAAVVLQYFLGPWFGPGVLVMGMREEMIEKYNITDEDSCRTCLVGCFCPYCAICQMSRELVSLKQHKGSLCVDAAFKTPYKGRPLPGDNTNNNNSTDVNPELNQMGMQQQQPGMMQMQPGMMPLNQQQQQAPPPPMFGQQQQVQPQPMFQQQQQPQPMFAQQQQPGMMMQPGPGMMMQQPAYPGQNAAQMAPPQMN